MNKKPESRISGPLREAIKKSGVSRHQLAQQVDVDEGVLSRFVNGKRGINLETADKLAEILGLTLVQGVSRVQPPMAPIEDERTPEQKEWDHQATMAAHIANQQGGPRRGVWENYFAAMDPRAMFLYNTAPIDEAPVLWERELNLLCERLFAESAYDPLGQGEAPPPCDREDTITHGLIIRRPKHKGPEHLSAVYERVVKELGHPT